jgi:hypothetical protein
MDLASYLDVPYPSPSPLHFLTPYGTQTQTQTPTHTPTRVTFSSRGTSTAGLNNELRGAYSLGALREGEQRSVSNARFVRATQSDASLIAAAREWDWSQGSPRSNTLSQVARDVERPHSSFRFGSTMGHLVGSAAMGAASGITGGLFDLIGTAITQGATNSRFNKQLELDKSNAAFAQEITNREWKAAKDAGLRSPDQFGTMAQWQARSNQYGVYTYTLR